MTNRIIKSLDCRKIILIFCILEVDFTISVITLFVAFNESFQKALVDKSVCVINIVHLIVLPAIKNLLFDVYFNRITVLLAVRFLYVMGAYLSPCALFAVSFLPIMRAYLSPPALFALRFLPFMRTYDFLCTLCSEIFACYGGISDFLRTLCSDIFACYGGINISDISLLGFHSYFDFCSPFYKTKKIK